MRTLENLRFNVIVWFEINIYAAKERSEYCTDYCVSTDYKMMDFDFEMNNLEDLTEQLNQYSRKSVIVIARFFQISKSNSR